MSTEISYQHISVKFVVQKLIMMANTFRGDNRAAWKQTANRRVNETQEQMVRKAVALNQHQKSQLRDINKHMCPVHTYINHIRDVMDVIFCHNCICCCQIQQIVIPGFCAFQLILWVLRLPLGRREETEQMRGEHISAGKWSSRKCSRVCSGSASFGTSLGKGINGRESLEIQATEKLLLDSNVLNATTRLKLLFCL